MVGLKNVFEVKVEKGFPHLELAMEELGQWVEWEEVRWPFALWWRWKV